MKLLCSQNNIGFTHVSNKNHFWQFGTPFDTVQEGQGINNIVITSHYHRNVVVNNIVSNLSRKKYNDPISILRYKLKSRKKYECLFWSSTEINNVPLASHYLLQKLDDLFLDLDNSRHITSSINLSR